MENLFREDTKKLKKRKKVAKATLSFAMDDEGGEDEDAAPELGRRSSSKDKEEDVQDGPPSKRGKFRKNPNVDTSFLPDREREEAERKERERLRIEWLQKQEHTKKEEIEVVYSFWDGSGHRKSVTVRIVPSGYTVNSPSLLLSARKATTSVAFWRSAASSSLNLEASVLIT